MVGGVPAEFRMKGEGFAEFRGAWPHHLAHQPVFMPDVTREPVNQVCHADRHFVIRSCTRAHGARDRMLRAVPTVDVGHRLALDHSRPDARMDQLDIAARMAVAARRLIKGKPRRIGLESSDGEGLTFWVHHAKRSDRARGGVRS